MAEYLLQPVRMDELDVIAQDLRRQRQALDEEFDQTARRSNETARLLDKIQELSSRSEATNRLFLDQQGE